MPRSTRPSAIAARSGSPNPAVVGSSLSSPARTAIAAAVPRSAVRRCSPTSIWTAV